MLRPTVPAIAISLGAVFCLTVWGAEPSGLAHPCAGIDESEARLACYDEAFGRPAGVPDTDRRTDPEKAREEFGLSEAQLQTKDPKRARDKGPDSIEAIVARLAYQPGGERVVWLDNRQIWLQTEVTIRGTLTKGDKVRIRKAALGSHMLVTPDGVALRVRRIE